MKKILVFLFVVALASCKKDSVNPIPNGTSPGSTIDSFDSSKAKLLSQGIVVGVNHVASGSVGLYENATNYVVYFDKLTANDGPDLKIYLSKDINAQEYIKLGNLKSTSGAQSYAVPANTDVSEYKYVHIWCERYTVVFARAELK